MKRFLILVLAILPVAPIFAQWSVTSVSSSPMEKQTSKISQDFWLDITIKNVSEDSQYVWAQREFHIIESFIKNAVTQVWDRQNVGICGTSGEPSWREVKAGEVLEIRSRQSKDEIGRLMMLTFPVSPTSQGTLKNSEILLGPFSIPKFAEERGEAARKLKG